MQRLAHSGPNWVELTFDPASQVIPGVGLKKVGVDNGDGTYSFVDAPDDLVVDPETASRLSDDERAAYGIAVVVEAPASRVVIDGLVDVDGVPHQAHRAKTLGERRAEKLAAIGAEAARRVAEGFPCVLAGETVRLQVRDQDLPRWLAMKAECDAAVAAGEGDAPYPIPVRTIDNVNVTVTCAQGASALADMQAWWRGLLANSWALKDAATPADESGLDAIDETSGWPS